MTQSAASVLSDGTILRLVEDGRIRIDPWDPKLVQPASVDLRLGDSFRVFHNYRASFIDLRKPPENLTEEVVVGSDESFVIHPGEFCLGRTLEWVELPDDIVARIEGKSRLARRVDDPARRLHSVEGPLLHRRWRARAVGCDSRCDRPQPARFPR